MRLAPVGEAVAVREQVAGALHGGRGEARARRASELVDGLRAAEGELQRPVGQVVPPGVLQELLAVRGGKVQFGQPGASEEGVPGKPRVRVQGPALSSAGQPHGDLEPIRQLTLEVLLRHSLVGGQAALEVEAQGHLADTDPPRVRHVQQIGHEGRVDARLRRLPPGAENRCGARAAALLQESVHPLLQVGEDLVAAALVRVVDGVEPPRRGRDLLDTGIRADAKNGADAHHPQLPERVARLHQGKGCVPGRVLEIRAELQVRGPVVAVADALHRVLSLLRAPRRVVWAFHG